MSKATLKTKIKSEIQLCFGAATDDTKLDCYCQALANAIVDWFEQDAKSLPGTFQDSMAGPVTGQGELEG